MPDSDSPLLQSVVAVPDQQIMLKDAVAPYRGIWILTDHGSVGLEALHATFHVNPRPSCLIEQRHFSAREQACLFVQYLHGCGWQIVEVNSNSSHFLVDIL